MSYYDQIYVRSSLIATTLNRKREWNQISRIVQYVVVALKKEKETFFFPRHTLICCKYLTELENDHMCAYIYIYFLFQLHA